MNITPITRQDRRPAGALRSVLGPVSRWIGRTQQAMSDRIHASGDVRALSRGWEITTATGPSGFGARACRDPRFADLQAAMAGEDYSRPAPVLRLVADPATAIDAELGSPEIGEAG